MTSGGAVRLHEGLDGFGFACELCERHRRERRIGNPDHLALSGGVRHGECAHAARRALDRVGDFLPGLEITRLENGAQFGDQLARLRLEQTENFGVERDVAARIARKMLQIDNVRRPGTFPEMERDDGRNFSRQC